MKEKILLHVNGQNVSVETDPETPLLYVLRNNLGLNGPKFGCGLEQCGACMVLIDGKAQTSCLLPIKNVKDSKITTLEGLIGQDGQLHPLQTAFIQEQAAQCGYCLNGMIMTAVSMLNENAAPDRNALNERMNQVLCRCGTYARFIRAIQNASNQSNKTGN
jgi:nicotinate dehydrogenase subunit A